MNKEKFQALVWDQSAGISEISTTSKISSSIMFLVVASQNYIVSDLDLNDLIGVLNDYLIGSLNGFELNNLQDELLFGLAANAFMWKMMDMNLLNQVYSELKRYELVQTSVGFSADIVHMNKNWYCYNKHMNKDFSVDAALNCLRSLDALSYDEQLTEDQKRCVIGLAQQLRDYLRTRGWLYPA